MGPGAARNWLKALRHLLEFAAAEGFRIDNPTQGIKLPPHKTDGRHTFTEQEIAKFEAHYPIGTKPRLAFALLLETGQRRGDVIRIGPQHISRWAGRPGVLDQAAKDGNGADHPGDARTATGA